MTRADVIMEKIATIDKVAKDERPEPGYWASNRATGRAMAQSDKGFGKYVAHDELIGKRYKKGLIGALSGLGIGTPIGAAIGAGLANRGYRGQGAMIGAAGGAILGSSIGQGVGTYKADKEFLGARGILLKGFSKPHLTDEARAKYLSDKYRGGGVKA
jgi:hypothetical protein